MPGLQEQMYNSIVQGNAAVTRKLLTEHPELRNTPQPLGRTWLHAAAGRGDLSVVKALVELGYSVDEPCEGSPETPLHYAAGKERLENARWLLDQGANVNAKDEYGRTPLMSAAAGGSMEIVRLLVERGADVAAQFGRPPQDAATIAETRGYAEIAKYLRSLTTKTLAPLSSSGHPGKKSDPRVAHVAQHLGKVMESSLQEMVPGTVRVAIHAVPPSPGRSHLTLFTTGLSDLPMQLPAGNDCSALAELLIDLPSNWPISEAALKNPDNYWPIEWLRELIHRAHGSGTCLASGDIVSNGEPPMPFAPNTKLSSLLLLEDDGVPPLRVQPRSEIIFYRVVPLYREERDLYESQGAVHLLSLFQKHQISKVVAPNRKNVALLNDRF